jgi:hypothetical protein
MSPTPSRRQVLRRLAFAELATSKASLASSRHDSTIGIVQLETKRRPADFIRVVANYKNPFP